MIDNIENIDENSKWISIKVKVVQIWENSHAAIKQIGLLGDVTGVIKFVIWANSEHPVFKLGKSYIIRNAIALEYNGRYQVDFNRKTVIEEI